MGGNRLSTLEDSQVIADVAVNSVHSMLTTEKEHTCIQYLMRSKARTFTSVLDARFKELTFTFLTLSCGKQLTQDTMENWTVANYVSEKKPLLGMSRDS